MSSYVTSPAVASPEVAPPAPEQAPAPRRLRANRRQGRELAGSVAAALARLAPTLLLAASLCLVTFVAGGGLNPETSIDVEIAITVGSGLLAASAILLAPGDRRFRGILPAALLLAFAALSAISIAWSVTPNASWQEAGRVFAYAALFIAAVALVRAAPQRWSSVLGAVALAAVVTCGYALLTKVLPSALDPTDTYARLRAPYGYWNATGLAAGMGVIACLWLGARRSGHMLLSALAYPATGLLLVTLMLSYSRGSVAVAVIGVATWMCIVPLRLRGAALLLLSGAGAAVAVAFDFADHALSSENVALTQRIAAGHRFGVLLIAMLLVLTIAGIAVGFATARKAPSRVARRRAGALLLSGLLIAVLALLGGLALSHRGLVGTISHDFSSLTNPNSATPANTPGRLTKVSSVRARYWKQAIEVFEAHPALGAGAEGYATASLRYKPPNLEARHAHGYLVQTLADLGLIGFGLTLALLIAWLIAAGRATHPFNRRWSRWRWRRLDLAYSPERIALLSMLCIVIAFGFHSLEDWTWYVPGTACTALLCAGWLAGRGRIEQAAQTTQHAEQQTQPAEGRWRHLAQGRISRARLAAAAIGRTRVIAASAVIVAALLTAWMQWQPQRSTEASQQALLLAESSPKRALLAAHSAVSHDPLSMQAMFTLAEVQQRLGDERAAQETLRRAAKLQPSNPETWMTLGVYELSHDPNAALTDLRAALYLNPQSIPTQNEYVLARRAAEAKRGR